MVSGKLKILRQAEGTGKAKADAANQQLSENFLWPES
jgi:hypothetical protein